MHAAFVKKIVKNPQLQIDVNASIPEPGSSQVLVRVVACGFCHTDLHAMTGDWPVIPATPYIPGHEVVGIIEKLSDSLVGDDGLREGMRVGMPWLYSACGRCEWCLTGRENLCPEQKNTGFSVNGGFATFLLAERAFVMPIPERMDTTHAAPLLCAGLTTYSALKTSKVSPEKGVPCRSWKGSTWSMGLPGWTWWIGAHRYTIVSSSRCVGDGETVTW